MEPRTGNGWLGSAWKWAVGPWMAGVICLAYLWAQPLREFQDPQSARIIFWHVPMAILGLVWFWVGAYHGIRYLYGSGRGNAGHDIRSHLANSIGLGCTILATVTGMVFAAVQWGTPWNWDPKQIGITVLIVIYMAYFGLRMSIDEPERRARLSAVYAILGAVSSIFLTYVIPQLPALKSLHPEGTITGGLDGKWKLIFWMSTLGFLGITAWIHQLRVRLALLEEAAGSPEETEGPAVRLEAVRKPLAEG